VVFFPGSNVKQDGWSLAYYVAYPEGDQREIEHELRVNQLVDLNGMPLPLPLPTSRMIVYRVWKVSTRQERYTEEITYHLELVTRPELDGIRTGRG
jgi:hypothetical protein